ncbi:uncharacterized protein PV09_05280 [Verruconis gallopava]|uniref:SUN-domain-containing protein n=1 Tax=Verruconis gallopava TaxID=253628 RepID=A0A0D2AAD9_9PEZI|nr:uncharacterized protein PV09_05280 [Verruconis gallopava]KIW03515.1 hypothetical protein PV09_05280 [Verruconis gallopava]
MRLFTTTMVAVSGAWCATAHNHARHHVRRAPSSHLVEKDVVVEMVHVNLVECWLDGHVIQQDECAAGVRNGSLEFVDGNKILPLPSTFTTYYVSSTSEVASQSTESLQSTSVQWSAPAPSSTSATPTIQASDAGYGHGNWNSNGLLANVDKEFPDGQIDCSHFPSDYGAMPLDWLNIGGWASVQKPEQDLANGYNDILSMTSNECPNGNCCVEGSFCSYACPDGYLKYQWPSKQGATGQSIGGLLCQNGKLHLTNPAYKTLCAKGSQNIKVTVKNMLSQNVAICRTNYPGDEKMSIPVNVNPGETQELACPDSSTYYKWENKGTSAQYYINMPGYSVEKACVWGDYGDDFGNWAPGNLGVGWSNGLAWLSIQANHPTQMQVTLPYTIEIIGGNTKCRYQNGQYCGGDNYSQCSTEGCTVSATGGEVTYVLS